ncbi:MAG: DoxX family protein [Actinomycetota bacterium]|jgi:putative oxidoreductase|nr:DoxX family protein [Actinomycetota bacterium]
MSDTAAIDVALLVFRCGIAAVMVAHGWNHIAGGGKIAGTAGWFGSMGMRWPLVQAWLASATELGAGALIALGLLTPFGAAGVVGVMTVAFVINHRGNGFFIFRPGEGWEYVLTLGLCGLLLGVVGPGSWSLDDAFGLADNFTGLTGLMVTVIAGIGGSAALLSCAWRPSPAPTEKSG